MSRHRASGLLVSGWLVAVTTGCATQQTMNNNARTAADRLAALQAEVQQKIAAENAYYDAELKSVAASLARSRRIAIEQQLKTGAETFVAESGGTATADQLATFLTAQVDAWKTSEVQRQQTLTQATDQLANGRQQLDANAAQLDQLENKLRTLGEARSKRALAAFVYGFARQTETDFEQQRAAAAATTPPPP